MATRGFSNFSQQVLDFAWLTRRIDLGERLLTGARDALVTQAELALGEVAELVRLESERTDAVRIGLIPVGDDLLDQRLKLVHPSLDHFPDRRVLGDQSAQQIHAIRD